jgi:hypothetical protein
MKVILGEEIKTKNIPRRIFVPTPPARYELGVMTAQIFGGQVVAQEDILDLINPDSLIVAPGTFPLCFEEGSSLLDPPQDVMPGIEGLVDEAWIDGAVWYSFLEEIKEVYPTMGEETIWYHQLGATMYRVFQGFHRLEGLDMRSSNALIEVDEYTRKVLKPKGIHYLSNCLYQWENGECVMNVSQALKRIQFNEI